MNDFKYPLQFDITLKRLSMSALLAYIYEHPDIKTKMYETICLNYKGPGTPFPTTHIKKEIIKLASQKIDSLELSKNLISELKGLLIFFAKNIAGWAEYVLTVLKMKLKYLDKIYWTYLGMIDHGKIFDSYWQAHKNFSEVLIPHSGVSNEEFIMSSACKYANEEVILANQNTIIEVVQKKLNGVELPNIKDEMDQIIGGYLHCCFFDKYKKDEYQKEIFNKFKDTGKVNISEILTLRGFTGLPKCIKYLWNFLNNAEKEKIIIELCRRNVLEPIFHYLESHDDDDDDDEDEDDDDDDDDEDKTKKEFDFELAGFAETVFFFITEMSPEQKTEFFKDNIHYVMQLFLHVWPYPEICLKMLNEDWIVEVIKSGDEGCDILHALVLRMSKDLSDLAFVSGSCRYPTIFYELLKKILSITSKEDKDNVFFDQTWWYAMSKPFPYAIQTFYYIFDLSALSIVINDKDLKDDRLGMVLMGDKKIIQLLEKGNLKMVISFMEKVLVSNDERKKFIKKWRLDINDSVVNNPDMHRKILNWLKN